MSRTFRKRTRNGVNDQKKLKIRILSEFFRCIFRQVWYSNISRVDKVHKIHIDFFFFDLVNLREEQKKQNQLNPKAQRK